MRPSVRGTARSAKCLTGREIARLARRGSERDVRLVLHRLVDNRLEAGAATLYALNREHVAVREGSCARAHRGQVPQGSGRSQ